MINDSIYNLLQKRALKSENNVLMDFPDEGVKYTGKTLLKMVQRIGKSLLKLNLTKGDRFGVWLSNRSEWVLLALAAGSLGLVMVPLNIGIREKTFSYFIKKSKIKVIFCSATYKDGVQLNIIRDYYKSNVTCLKTIVLDSKQKEGLIDNPMLWNDFVVKENKECLLPTNEVSNIDDWLIQFTSGTTGLPKGVRISQFGAINVANAYGNVINLNETDKVLQVLPYFHCIGSIMGLLSIIIFGAKTTVLSKFNPIKANSTLMSNQCSIMLGVPTIYLAMIKSDNFSQTITSSLRVVGIGGTGCPSNTFDYISNAFPSSTVMCAYGLTEVSSMIVAPNIDDNYTVRKQTVGHVIPGIKLKIDSRDGDRGELLVKGFSVTKGYVDDIDKTKQLIDPEGWLHTGDIAELIGNNVKIIGRADDMIEKGGEKISPHEIEAVLTESIGDTKVCVAGVQDEKYGEEIIAFVECANGKSVGVLSEKCRKINKDLAEKIMWFEIPKFLAFVPIFPRTKSGKIERKNLREMFLNHKLVVSPLRSK